MYLKSPETQCSKRFQRYLELTGDGLLYEYLGKEIPKITGASFNNRSEIKECFFQTVYSDNRFIGIDEAVNKRAFRDLFPEVYQIFAWTKRHDSSNLACLLQRIESDLILRIIAKRIAREHPGLFFITIHDSIVTTMGSEQYIKAIIEEEMNKVIGAAPKIKLEFWHPANMAFSDGSPFLQ